jgi:hypothetical protein
MGNKPSVKSKPTVSVEGKFLFLNSQVAEMEDAKIMGG